MYLFDIDLLILIGWLWFQGKKLPESVTNDEGDVTDEDEGAESDKKRNSKKVGHWFLLISNLN